MSENIASLWTDDDDVQVDQDPGYPETPAATRSCQLRRSAPGQVRLEDSLCDLSCDSLDLDSVSQVSLAESSPGPEDRERMFKCVSSENISRAGKTDR